MAEISRTNSATVELAVESAESAVRNKAAGADMTFARDFAAVEDLWRDVDVGVLGTWEKAYRVSPVLEALQLGTAKKALMLGILQAARKKCVWIPPTAIENQKTIPALAGLVDPARFTIKKIKASIHQKFWPRV